MHLVGSARPLLPSVSRPHRGPPTWRIMTFQSRLRLSYIPTEGLQRQGDMQMLWLWRHSSRLPTQTPSLQVISHINGEYSSIIRKCYSTKSMGDHSPIHTFCRVVCSEQSQPRITSGLCALPMGKPRVALWDRE